MVKDLEGGLIETAELADNGWMTLRLKFGEDCQALYRSVTFALDTRDPDQKEAEATIGSGGKIYLPVDEQNRLRLRPGDRVLIWKNEAVR